jgi:hypothetical protein
MGKSATATDRAPRGTKVLAQAFFTAADGIPDDRRDAVVKAALALIREQLKDVRDKAKAAKAKHAGAKGPAARKRSSAQENRSQESWATRGTRGPADRGAG